MGLSSQLKAWLLAGTTLAAGLGVMAVIYTGQRGAGPVAEGEPLAAPATAPDTRADATAAPEPEPQDQPLVAPAFDVVRVAEDGGALVAGSALAGAAVILRVDGAVMAQTSADNAGQFVLLFSLPPSDAVQIMTLEMVLADGRALSSDDRVVLAPRPEMVAALDDAVPGHFGGESDTAEGIPPGTVAAETVELALLQPEASDLSAGAAIEPAVVTVPAPQAPGHEVAAGALGQELPQADDRADAPVVGRDVPPAPVEVDPEATTAGSAGQAAVQAQVRAEATAEPATETITETATETTTAPETATASLPESAEAPARLYGAAEPEPEVMQARVHVPGQTPEAASAPAASETAPRLMPGAPEPGHQAAAIALEVTAAPVDAGSDARVVVGEAPAPAPEAVTPEAVTREAVTPGPTASGLLPDDMLPGEDAAGHVGTEETVGTAAIEEREDASETAERAEVTERADIPGAPDTRETQEVDDITETSEVTEATEIADAADTTENPWPRAFMLRGSGEVTLLDRAPQVMDNIVIDLISYSDAGAVQISGRAASGDAGARVQIYLDNRPIATALAENGDWTSDLPSVDPGVYTLRVDQLDSEDRVVSRFETPFQREDPAYVRETRAQSAADEAARLAQAGDTGTAGATDAGDTGTNLTEAGITGTAATERAETAPQTAVETGARSASPAVAISGAPATVTDPVGPAGHPSVALMTVQPGHSLWRISEGHYGAGNRYLLIYNANRGQIRNPDLIYPGQIFKLPE